MEVPGHQQRRRAGRMVAAALLSATMGMAALGTVAPGGRRHWRRGKRTLAAVLGTAPPGCPRLGWWGRGGLRQRQAVASGGAVGRRRHGIWMGEVHGRRRISVGRGERRGSGWGEGSCAAAHFSEGRGTMGIWMGRGLIGGGTFRWGEGNDGELGQGWWYLGLQRLF